MVDITDRARKLREVAYYPGCALEGSGNGYDVSTRAIAYELGLKLRDVKDWNCCGAMEVKNIDPKIQTYLSSRVLSPGRQQEPEQRGDGAVQRLLSQPQEGRVRPRPRRRARARSSASCRQKAGHKTYEAGQAETIHALDWIKDTIGEEGLRQRTKGKLAGLKIANYYGCMYVRPRHIFPEKDKGPGSESTSQAALHGRPAGRGRRRERRVPAEDRLLRRRAHAVGLRHLDQARAQHPAGGRSVRRGGDRHRMPDLPLRPRDAPDPRREALRQEDQREDPLLHAAARAWRSASARASSASRPTSPTRSTSSIEKGLT